MEVDWPSTKETRHQHNKASADMETPPGNRNQGRPRATWRKEFLKVLRDKGYTRGEAEKKSKNNEEWRNFIRGLYYPKE